MHVDPIIKLIDSYEQDLYKNLIHEEEDQPVEIMLYFTNPDDDNKTISFMLLHHQWREATVDKYRAYQFVNSTYGTGAITMKTFTVDDDDDNGTQVAFNDLDSRKKFSLKFNNGEDFVFVYNLSNVKILYYNHVEDDERDDEYLLYPYACYWLGKDKLDATTMIDHICKYIKYECYVRECDLGNPFTYLQIHAKHRWGTLKLSRKLDDTFCLNHHVEVPLRNWLRYHKLISNDI